MPDPFRALAVAERLRNLGIAVAILAVIGGAGLLFSRPWEQGGQLVQAEVRQFGVVTGKYGNRPIVTVRMPDGSARRLLGSRMLPSGCEPGDKIELMQTADVVTLGRRGCYG